MGSTGALSMVIVLYIGVGNMLVPAQLEACRACLIPLLWCA